MAGSRETAKYPPGSGTDLAKHLQEQASFANNLSQFNHNSSNQMATALSRSPFTSQVFPPNQQPVFNPSQDPF